MKSMWFGMGLVAVAVSLGLASCGESAGGTGTNTTAIQLGPTNYETRPPTQSTVAPPVTTAGPQPEQEYIIEAGDYPATIANKFNVSFNELMELNGWTLQGQMAVGFPPVGTPIRIPAGGSLPGETLPPQTTIATTGAPGAIPTTVAVTAPVFTAAPTTTLDPACIGEDYTIQSGDIPSRVATKFGVTVQQLNAVNANTKGYGGFVVGAVIKIPSGAEGC